MKIIRYIGAITVLCILLQLFLPWYIVMLVCFIISALSNSKLINLMMASFGVNFIIWLVFSFYLDYGNDSILSGQISELFSLTGAIVLILVCSMVIGIAAMTASIAGYYTKQLFGK